jgi:HEAT repeat protein
VAATADELRAALAPLVFAADATDPEERHHARAALIESAPPFLDSLIARLAADDGFKGPAVEALGRMATTSSRAHLRNLFRRSAAADRPAIALVLARIGHHDDADFFATVLEDRTADPLSRRYGALGLGRIGGDRAVRALERASSAAPAGVRPSIATALGNTRSHAAVPVLISMFGETPAQNEVCGALVTLTHRAWCDGTADNPAAKRTRWRRWWKQIGSKTSIYGPDNCPPDSIAPLSAPHDSELTR